MADTTAPAKKRGQRIMSQAQLDAMFALERKVMDLRTTGKSFHMINKELKIQNSHQVFKRAIDRDDNIQYRRAEAIRLEEARLDALQEGIWGRAMGGDPRAVEVALKVLERRARMLGLDFADLISGKLIEVEQAKVALMATALTETFRELNLPVAQQKEATTLMFKKIRELSAEKMNTVDGQVVSDHSDLL